MGVKPRGGREGGLYEKLKWFLFFRVIMVTVLLGATLVLQIREQESYSSPALYPLYVLIILTYIVSLLSGFLVHRISNLQGFSFFQFFWDGLFVTVLIYLTGGVESPFAFLYILNIINASILLFRTGAITVATLSSLLYSALILVEAAIIPLPSFFEFLLPEDPVRQREFFFNKIFVNVLAFFCVAYLSGYLSELVREAGEKLVKKEVDYEALEVINKNIVQSIGSGLITVDGDGLITSYNRAAEEITGYRLEDVYMEPVEKIFSHFSPPHVSVMGDGNLSQSVLQTRWDTTFQRSDGREIYLGFSQSFLKNNLGEEIGRIFSFQDLTKLREMQEEVKRSEKLASIGQLAAGIAHEIRNPLASMSGSIQLLREEVDLGPDQKRLMDITLRETDRLNTLIKDFLGFARPPPNSYRQVDLSQTLRETVEVFKTSLRGRDSIVFSLSLPETLFVEMDCEKIKQVFWNLFNNALEAMPDGGRLQVETISSNGLQVNKKIEIRVTDNGVGIDEGELTKIFDPFYTTKEEGTGLGLATVYRIIESHQGSIWVESAKGAETTFIIRLPLRQSSSIEGNGKKNI